MKSVFADSGYWFALINPRDELRARALSVPARLGQIKIVTSEFVLAEVLNHFAEKGTRLRKTAVATVRKLRARTDVRIEPVSDALFERAFFLYERRADKGWSLTDCASILVMQDEGISDVLSHDTHFQQAGFRVLLRED